HTRWPRDWSSDVCSSDLEGRMDMDGVADHGVRRARVHEVHVHVHELRRLGAHDRGSENPVGLRIDQDFDESGFLADLPRLTALRDRKSTRLNSSHVATSY